MLWPLEVCMIFLSLRGPYICKFARCSRSVTPHRLTVRIWKKKSLDPSFDFCFDLPIFFSTIRHWPSFLSNLDPINSHTKRQYCYTYHKIGFKYRIKSRDIPSFTSKSKLECLCLFIRLLLKQRFKGSTNVSISFTRISNFNLISLKILRCGLCNHQYDSTRKR